jgi:hypothetical protein
LVLFYQNVVQILDSSTGCVTKQLEVYAVPSQEASIMADVLVTNFFCHFVVKRELHSDQGQNFES